MNGTYQPLVNYISEDSYREINEYEKKHEEENRFRIKNFFDKYSDNFINFLITSIKNCNIMHVYNSQTWNFSYNILGSDIKILDPNNPDNALIVIKLFFKKCCKILNVELVNFELSNQDHDQLEFTVFIKNPFIEKREEKIEKYMI